MSDELGFIADEVDEVQIRGQRISSSQDPRAARRGRVNLARRMLGRPYGVEGVIIRGNRRGHTIGFPTANLKPHNRVIPKYGVYATATLIDGAWRRSITNIGVRPTFENTNEPSIETYIFDFDGDLYGDVLRVRFPAPHPRRAKVQRHRRIESPDRKGTRRCQELFQTSGRTEYAEICITE